MIDFRTTKGKILLLVASAWLSSVISFFAFEYLYSMGIYEIRDIGMEVYVQNTPGLNVDSDALHFGIVPPGASGRRNITIENDDGDFCKSNGIDCIVSSFKEELGRTFDDMMRGKAKGRVKTDACSLCRMYRMTILQKLAKKSGAGRIILGSSLDDEASRIMASMFSGSSKDALGFMPVLTPKGGSGDAPVSMPLHYCTDKETGLYCRIRGFRPSDNACPYRKGSFEETVARKLDSMERDFRGTKSAVIQNFLLIAKSLGKA